MAWVAVPGSNDKWEYENAATAANTYADAPGTYSGGIRTYTTPGTGLVNKMYARTRMLGNQNMLLYSEEFDVASWAKLNSATVTANTTTAPDGTTTADTITFAAATNSGLQQPLGVSQVSGNDYTFSIWIKRIGETDTDINLNMSDGLGSTIRGKTATADWTRVEATRTSTNNAVGLVQIRNGVASVQSVYVWGAQVNQGVPTPYRPTGASVSAVIERGELSKDFFDATHVGF